MAVVHFAEIAVPHLGGRHVDQRADAVAFARAFEVEEEERAVAAVVELRDQDRTAQREAVGVRAVARQPRAARVVEEQIRVQRRVAQELVGVAVKSLVPLLITRFMMLPPERPYSADSVPVCSLNSAPQIAPAPTARC